MISPRDTVLVPVRFARGAAAASRRVSHGLDVAILGILMEIAARFAERQLLAAAKSTVPDPAASDQA